MHNDNVTNYETLMRPFHVSLSILGSTLPVKQFPHFHSPSKIVFSMSKASRKKVRKSSGNLCSQNQTDLHLQVEGRLQKGFQNNARALLKAKTKGQYYTFTDDTCSNTCS